MSDFAKVEVGFWLRDRRFRKLTNAGKVCYMTLWLAAREQLREVLPVEYGLKELAADSGLHAETARKMLQSCANNGLISIKDPHNCDITARIVEHSCADSARIIAQKCEVCGAEGFRISVDGIESKHKGLPWKSPDFLVCAHAGGRKSRSQEVKKERVDRVDSKSGIENDHEKKGEPPIGAVITGVRAVRNDLLAKAAGKIKPDAVRLLVRIVNEIKSADVLAKALEVLERCPRQLCLMVRLSVNKNNPAAYFTDLVKRGEIDGEKDADRVWAEDMSYQRQAVEG